MKPKFSPLAAASAVSMAAILFPGLAQGAVYVGITSENFDYAPGPLGTAGGGVGFNSSGDPSLANTTNWGGTGTVSAGTLSYPEAPYVSGGGNRVSISANSVNRALGQSVDAGTVYFSYLTQRTNDTNRTVNYAFFNGGSERFAIGQFGTASYNGQGNIEVSPINTTANIIQSSNPIAYGTGVTHLIIGRIVFDPVGTSDQLTLWVDPNSVQLTAALVDESTLTPYLTGNFDIQGFTNIRPFTGSAITGFSAANADFDEIRFGTTLESVIIPEPGAAALLLLGGLGWMSRRRR